ncbi:MAG: hypothetical protein ABJG79_04040 [Nitratireductor sp.]
MPPRRHIVSAPHAGRPRPARALRQRRRQAAGAARALAAFLRVAATLEAVTGVPAAVIAGPVRAGQGRRRPVRFARQAALYLTVTVYDVPASVLARALERPRWRVSCACQRAELARDEPAVEALYTRIERML